MLHTILHGQSLFLNRTLRMGDLFASLHICKYRKYTLNSLIIASYLKKILWEITGFQLNTLWRLQWEFGI